jgi:hypothetical protein
MDAGARKSLDLYREVWISLAYNRRYANYVTERDIETFRRRVANEGLTFLTDVLPQLGKALDSSWSLGNDVQPLYVLDGTKTLKIQLPVPRDFDACPLGIPVFLGKAFRAALRGDSQAVDCIRQLSYMFYKLDVNFDRKVQADFLDRFEMTDREVGEFRYDAQAPVIKLARGLIAEVLHKEDPRKITPRHGAGATACRTPNSEKYHGFRYSQKLDDFFSYSDYFFYNATHLSDEMAKLETSEELVPMARVCLVPKDSRGPRIISCEPREFMYIQQGLMNKLYQILGTHYLTKGFVNFEDQGINRALAYQSSIDGTYATLDLTDASDRVSLALVRDLFPLDWVEAFEACRSERTLLPDGRIVELQKFAPMGSSVCFPVEALAFWALACAQIRITSGILRPDVYVYGDDIIVPTSQAGIVVDGLHYAGLKVSKSKSYVDGPFRESCGGDYHKGYNVTPVRIREAIGASISSIATDADLCNSFVAKFGAETVASLINLIDSAQPVPFPRSGIPQPCCILMEPSASNDVFYRRKWNHSLQRWEYRIRRVSLRTSVRHEPDWCELLRKELTRGSFGRTTEGYENRLRIVESSLPPGHYAEPHSDQIKWDWVWLG